MVVFCEECGEKYVIDENETKGSAMIFICSICNDIIRIPANKTANKTNERKTTVTPAENV